jgi:hypothetical protein
MMVCAPDTQERLKQAQTKSKREQGFTQTGELQNQRIKRGKINSAHEIQKSVFPLRMNKITTDP